MHRQFHVLAKKQNKFENVTYMVNMKHFSVQYKNILPIMQVGDMSKGTFQVTCSLEGALKVRFSVIISQ